MSLANRSKEQAIAVRRVTGRRGGRGIRGTVAVSAKAEAEETAPAAQRQEQERSRAEVVALTAQVQRSVRCGAAGSLCFLIPVLLASLGGCDAGWNWWEEEQRKL